MEKIKFRRPGISDVKMLRDYINKLIMEDTYILASGKPYTLKEEQVWVKDLVAGMGKGDAYSAVAECEGKIAGEAHLVRKTPRFLRQRHVGVFGVSVAKKFRGKGIGELLSKQVLARAKEMGIKLVVLDVFANNRVAQKLYEKLGFRKAGRLPKALLFKRKFVDEITMTKVMR